jgi:hypothetical protein
MHEDENRTTSDFKRKENGFELKDGQSKKDISFRNWHSAELPTTAEQRKLCSDYLNKKNPELSTLPWFTNEHHNFHCSVLQSSSLSSSASTEEFPSYKRHLSLFSRKSTSLYVNCN